MDVTLYSTGFCAPCRAARTVLAHAASKTGITVTDINLADHPEEGLVHGITSTPTIIGYRDGTEVWRLTGVPKLAELETLLRHG